MMDKKELKELVFTNPLGLLALKSKEDIDAANSYLPYSTGFEIECDQMPGYDVEHFTCIPNIMEIKSDRHEQRYRIPNGINGLICLYHISNEAKKSLYLNDGPTGSGIHYHVDCTECWTEDFGREISVQSQDMLKDLALWKNKGTYNSRGVYVYIKGFSSGGGSWVRTNSLCTLEFRIGEMTFEYTDWVKCIVEVNHLVKRVKDAIKVPEPTYKDVDFRAIMAYNNRIIRGRKNKSRQDFLKEKLDKLKASPEPASTSPNLEDIRNMIRNRTQNL